jgi:hypothetical protein
MTIAREELFGPMPPVLPDDYVAGRPARATTASESRSPRTTPGRGDASRAAPRIQRPSTTMPPWR